MARPRTPESELTPSSIQQNKRFYIARQNEPQVAGHLGAPSRWLSKEQKKIWRALVRFSPAVLGESDRCLLEIACVLESKLEGGTVENALISQLISVLSKLGLVPKSRMAVPDKKKIAEPDAWEEL
jgi:phage terminase small subunit